MAHGNFRRFAGTLLGVVGLSLGACQDYQVTLNERPLYQPPTLIDKIALADQSLETCIGQIIADQRITDIQAFTRLRCSSTGVRSVSGLEQLSFLEEVDLSNNALVNIDSLFSLPHLKRLHVQDNETLDCMQLKRLQEKNPELQLEAPDHCQAVL